MKWVKLDQDGRVIVPDLHDVEFCGIEGSTLQFFIKEPRSRLFLVANWTQELLMTGFRKRNVVDVLTLTPLMSEGPSAVAEVLQLPADDPEVSRKHDSFLKQDFMVFRLIPKEGAFVVAICNSLNYWVPTECH